MLCQCHRLTRSQSHVVPSGPVHASDHHDINSKACPMLDEAHAHLGASRTQAVHYQGHVAASLDQVLLGEAHPGRLERRLALGAGVN